MGWQLQAVLAPGAAPGGAEAHGDPARVALSAEVEADVLLCLRLAHGKPALPQAWRGRAVTGAAVALGKARVLTIVSLFLPAARAAASRRRLKRCWSDGVDF